MELEFDNPVSFETGARLMKDLQWSSGSVSRFHTTGPGSIPGLGKVDLAFDPYCSGSLNEHQACLGTNTGDIASD
ncbi:hypothetical protein TNCV_4573121 [Trichonephila clavipes]|nr:hypothetical protein TNCV_4573121 [Trichonephila clavipes]